MTEATNYWGALAAAPSLAKSGDTAKLREALARAARGAAPADAATAERRRALVEKIAGLYGVPLDALDTPVSNPVPAGAGISLVTCCRNRNENLLKALPSWLACPEITEIVIVDWTSGEKVAPAILAAGLDDPRIRVIRVEDEPRWILSHAFNVGFQHAREEKILKTDADIVLDPDFFRLNPLRPGQFIAGNWRRAKEGQAFVNGFFYVWRDTLMKIGGFNEYITTYGWDDDEIYSRFLEEGLTRVDVSGDTIYHLPHDDAARTEKAPPPSTAPAIETLPASTIFLIRRNRQLTNAMPVWNGTRPPVEYERLVEDETRPVLRRRPGSGDAPPATIATEAFLAAARELLAWRLGDVVYGLELDRIDRLVRTRRWDDIDLADIIGAKSSRPDQIVENQRWLLIDARQAAPAAAGEAWAAIAPKLGASGLTPVWLGGAPQGYDGPALDTHVQLAAGEPIDLKALARPELLTARAYTLVLDHGQAPAPTPRPAAPQVQTRKRARLYADGQHGLGNRMRALGSAAAIAAATDRELVVVWEPDFHCDCRFTDLFDYVGPVEHAAFAADAAGKGAAVFNYMEIEEGAQKDQPVEMKDGQDVYLRSAYVLRHPASNWTTENDFLRSLRPAEAVLQLIDQVRWPNNVSVHVRMAGGKQFEHLPWESVENWTQKGHDQVAYWRERSHYSAFLKRIDALLEAGEADTFFLAADLTETYRVFEERYGDRIAYLPRSINDRSAEQLRYALADALLLSRAHRLLGSTWSSFSELAMRLAEAPMKVEMSGKDF
jgi:hypothetical protein